MNISITPQMEKWIQEKVESGFYQSASEVVRDAIRLLRDYEHLRSDQLQTLRGELLIGLQDLEAGRSQPLSDDLFEQIKAKGRERRTAMRDKSE